MKNKKLSWILLPGVLAIWAAIGWQVYAAMKSDDEAVNEQSLEQIAPTTKSVVPDTFVLLLDYRDPFLDDVVRKTPPPNSQSKNAISVAKKTLPPPTPAATWPTLSYSGLVRHSGSERSVGFLSVNGNSHFVKTGDIVEGLRVGKVWKDSVEVVMGKETKIIRK